VRSPTRTEIGPSEGAVSLDHLDLAARHGAREVFRNVLDHVLFAGDQCGPVEFWLAYCNLMHAGALDVVKGLPSGDRHLLRRAATVRTSAAKIAPFDHRDRQSRASDRAGHADPGIAAADDHDVEFLRAHRSLPSSAAANRKAIICW
jgi:hypothetical protein